MKSIDRRRRQEDMIFLAGMIAFFVLMLLWSIISLSTAFTKKEKTNTPNETEPIKVPDGDKVDWISPRVSRHTTGQYVYFFPKLTGGRAGVMPIVSPEPLRFTDD